MKSDSALIDINHSIFEMKPIIIHRTVSKKLAEMQLRRNLAGETLEKLQKIQQTTAQELVISELIGTGTVYNGGLTDQFLNRPPLANL